MRKQDKGAPKERKALHMRTASARPAPAGPLRKAAEPYLELLGEATIETLWPRRCCLCDRPGPSLCNRCQSSLPYIDALWSCPRCGAAFGRNSCTECNRYTLSSKGLSDFPLSDCRSVVRATADSLRVVSSYKDKGDRELAWTMAKMMARILPTAWPGCFLVPIPARPSALRKRGFDHMDLVAKHLSRITRLHRADLLVGTNGMDQRKLDAGKRRENAKDAFRLRCPKAPPKSVILVDDVMTTGSTLSSATTALKNAGTQTVFALTFARV